MFSFPAGHRRLFLLCMLFGFVLLPLSPQTNDWDDDDDFWNEMFLEMEGEGITIVGAANTTQQMEIVDRETITATHAADLPSLLEESLDLVVTRYGPYGNMSHVSLRGFSLKRIRFLLTAYRSIRRRQANLIFSRLIPVQ